MPASPLGLVLCPPFADEAVHARRALVDTGRRLAAAGVVTLLLDYRGTGDSEGEFEEGSLDAYVGDIRAAGDFLRARAGLSGCGLLGLRLGANLALRAAAADARLSPLVLWAPLDDVAAYFRGFLRLRLFAELSTAGRATSTIASLEAQLGSGMHVDVLGHPVSPAMARSFAQEAPDAVPADRTCLVLEVDRRRRGAWPGGEERATPDAIGRRRVPAEPFWEGARVVSHEAMVEGTLAWLADVAGRA